MYDFDKLIERSGTNAYKLDLRQRYFGTDDVIPLWVADMDFAAPEAVQQAIQERAKHEIYGYTIRKEEFTGAIVDWCQYKHNWVIKNDWIEYSPGVVPALVFSVLAFSEIGDGVIINTPVYPPFYSVVADNKRKILANGLVNVDGKYEIDFELLEKQASLSDTKIFILCSPHNPVGRVWTKEELLRVHEICSKHNVLVLADEIHADLTLFGHEHTPFASLNEEAAMNCISFMAPSKTFNIAGFSTSYVITANPKLLKAYRDTQNRLQLHMGHLFSGVALCSAYNHGRDWLEALKAYLERNILFVEDFLKEKLPEISFYRPEATYLIWMSFKAWNKSQKEIKDFLVKEAKVGLNDGVSFGKDGEGFMRMNIASPRSVLEQALNQIYEARK
ncbi:PatB family C-S lyase [Carboxylicivirga mesophila]|uniref:cysteine-S-conjugate beta-lyase n=1 Tax=Carboxylicivirga mesophila TaxID=1166478 RepID=A0ABS5KB80_9BACT|nr:PatB family C-S lyase [Carboxylicivirga mesophila]MBS2212241.1 PatB family C-S lyase [Carboxylicivirga mesophila]